MPMPKPRITNTQHLAAAAAVGTVCCCCRLSAACMPTPRPQTAATTRCLLQSGECMVHYIVLLLQSGECMVHYIVLLHIVCYKAVSVWYITLYCYTLSATKR